jgi:hypothetical protein
MSYKMNITKNPDFLHVHASGVRTRESVAALANDVKQACIDHQTPKVLVDVRDMSGGLNIMDILNLVTTVFPKLKDYEVLNKAAIVDSKETGFRYPILETIARNRAYNIRIFKEPSEAIEWLTQ